MVLAGSDIDLFKVLLESISFYVKKHFKNYKTLFTAKHILLNNIIIFMYKKNVKFDHQRHLLALLWLADHKQAAYRLTSLLYYFNFAEKYQ